MRGQPGFWPRYFLTLPDEIFFNRRAKNWKIWDFRGNFPNPNPNQRWLTQSNQSNKKFDPTRSGSKILTRTHHYKHGQILNSQPYILDFSQEHMTSQPRILHIFYKYHTVLAFWYLWCLSSSFKVLAHGTCWLFPSIWTLLFLLEMGPDLTRAYF